MNARRLAHSSRSCRGERGTARVEFRGWGARVAGEERGWLPDMDLNHDKQIQSLLCYRYTIGQSVQRLPLGIRG